MPTDKKVISAEASDPTLNPVIDGDYVDPDIVDVDGITEGQGIDPDMVPLTEIGVAGAKVYSGYVQEEFLPKLQGDRGRRVYREMRDNDATIGAILFAIEMLLRATPWTVEIDTDEMEAEDGEGGKASARATPNVKENIDDPRTPEGAVAFLESVIFNDMEDTWEDVVANVLTCLTFGWQYTEMVFKRRMGLDANNPHYKSKYDDGYIGIRKLLNIAQETLDKWEINEKGEIAGIWQFPPDGTGGINAGGALFIPFWKSLLFRPTPNKDSPEGRSAIRNAYRSWYFLKNIQEIEAIAIERELNGLPVVSIPNSLLNSTDPKVKAVVRKYEQIARDIKFNSQGGVVIPSDTFKDDEGRPSSARQVMIDLVSAGGSRAIDTNKTIMRYSADIARTVLADFIMLGQGEKGSFALSKSKTDLFLGALEGWNNMIAAVFNRNMVPLLWELNGFDMNVMPYLKPGRVAPEDLQELGEFLKSLAASGFTLAPDEDTEEHLRDVAGLPAKPLVSDEDLEAEENITAGMPNEEERDAEMVLEENLDSDKPDKEEIDKAVALLMKSAHGRDTIRKMLTR